MACILRSTAAHSGSTMKQQGLVPAEDDRTLSDNLEQLRLLCGDEKRTVFYNNRR